MGNRAYRRLGAGMRDRTTIDAGDCNGGVESRIDRSANRGAVLDDRALARDAPRAIAATIPLRVRFGGDRNRKRNGMAVAPACSAAGVNSHRMGISWGGCPRRGNLPCPLPVETDGDRTTVFVLSSFNRESGLRIYALGGKIETTEHRGPHLAHGSELGTQRGGGSVGPRDTGKHWLPSRTGHAGSIAFSAGSFANGVAFHGA